MKIKKNYILIILMLFVFLIFVLANIGNFTKDRTIVRLKGVSTNESIKDFNIASKSIFVWADPVLYIADKDGNIINKLQTEGENIEVLFANNYAFVYDKDLGQIQMYSEFGEILSTINMRDEVFNITYENANIIIHTRNEKNEHLYLMDNNSSLSEIYKTGNKILTHDIVDEKNLAVAELKENTNGFSSLLYSVKNGDTKSKELSHEIIMFVKTSRNSVLTLTDKYLYRFLESGEIYKEKVPNVLDILVEGRDTLILHSGIITTYNFKLEPQEKKIIAANVNRMKNVSGSIYVYGPSDVGGEIGSRGEFYTRLGYSLDKMQINGLTIGALRNGELSLYSVVNSNLVEENENKLDTNYKEV